MWRCKSQTKDLEREKEKIEKKRKEIEEKRGRKKTWGYALVASTEATSV